MKPGAIRILIVEDQEPFHIVYARILKKLTDEFEGSVVTVTKRLDEAIKIVADKPVTDIVILDLNLEDSVMEETLKRLHEIEEHAPLVIVTGYSVELVKKLIQGPREYAIVSKDEGLFTGLLKAIVKALSLRAEARYQEQRARLAKMEEIVRTNHEPDER